jgi:hypothetical protein
LQEANRALREGIPGGGGEVDFREGGCTTSLGDAMCDGSCRIRGSQPLAETACVPVCSVYMCVVGVLCACDMCLCVVCDLCAVCMPDACIYVPMWVVYVCVVCTWCVPWVWVCVHAVFSICSMYMWRMWCVHGYICGVCVWGGRVHAVCAHSCLCVVLCVCA